MKSYFEAKLAANRKRLAMRGGSEAPNEEASAEPGTKSAGDDKGGVIESPLTTMSHPLAAHALAVLRDRTTAAFPFRQAAQQLLMMMIYEACKAEKVRDTVVESFHGSCPGAVMVRPVLLLNVARHGLGIAHQAAELFPNLQVGSIGLEKNRDGRNVEARLHLANAPALTDATVLLFQPVISSGATGAVSLEMIQRFGAQNVFYLSFVASRQGIERLPSAHPQVRIITAGLDEEYDAKRGPLPGLGNFSARLFG